MGNMVEIILAVLAVAQIAELTLLFRLMTAQKESDLAIQLHVTNCNQFVLTSLQNLSSDVHELGAVIDGATITPSEGVAKSASLSHSLAKKSKAVRDTAKFSSLQEWKESQ